MCGTPKSATCEATKSVTCETPKSATCETPESALTPVEGEDYIKLSFRGVGPSNFIAHLEMVLQKQEWKTLMLEQSKERSFDPVVVGVAGLLRKVDVNQKDSDVNLSIAFSDLDSLMNKASEMVKLAESVSNKLASKIETVDDQLERDFRSLVMEMGVSSAVTKEMTGSLFHIELARQLGDFCHRLLERRQTPMVSLADVYCVYNRARGTNLVSPDEIYQAASLLSEMSMPVKMQRLPSGLVVIQSRSQSDEAILKSICQLVPDETISIDALDVSRAENLPLSIALMYLEKAEHTGFLCRDESPSGTHYYINKFLESE